MDEKAALQLGTGDRDPTPKSRRSGLGAPAWAKVTSWLCDKKSNFNTN